MDKVKNFLNGIPKGKKSAWAKEHGMDPVRLSQIAGGHKGVGLEYAAKLIDASGGVLVLSDFLADQDPAAERAAA